MSTSSTGCGSLDKSQARPPFWQTQPPVDWIDTSLVINTWETVEANLSSGKPARLWYIIVEQTNNGATAETIELEITINGTAYTITFVGLGSGTFNHVYMNFNLSAGDFQFVPTGSRYTVGSPALDVDHNIPFIAESVELIRVRQTTAVDVTSAQIEVNIIWDRHP